MWPPTGLIHWFSKIEGNTYAALLHHPFLFKGKPTQCSKGSRTPPHYGQYVPLVHVLNHGNIHGDAMVIFFTITTSVHILRIFKI